MRKLATVFALLVCAVLLASMLLITPATRAKMSSDSSVPPDTYDFPIKPGTPEWQALNSHEEMVRACQIPEATLQSMSTAGLVETVLNYPLLGDMIAYNSFQEGFNTMASEFNGLAELLQRPEAGSELLTRYRAMDPAAIDVNWTPEQRGQYAFRIAYVETLLAQDTIRANLTEAELHNLLAETVIKLRLKQEQPEVYGQFSLGKAALLVGRIMQQMDASLIQQ